MKSVFYGIVVLLFVGGCGGASKGARGTRAYKEMPASEPSADYAAEESAGGEVLYEADYGADESADYFLDDTVEGNLIAPASPAPSPGSVPPKKASKEDSTTHVSNQGNTGPINPNDKPIDKAKPDKPMVVYTGYLKLRVKRLLDAVDAITARTEEKKGYIESLSSNVIIIRIPADDFEAAMAAYAEFGDLLAKEVTAADVTRQFTDLGARLAVAKEARNRLLALLKKVEDVEERLRILQEIKRLSEQIESIESRLSTLQNLVDYYTITIELEPILEGENIYHHRSFFPWIRDLSAHRTTIYDGQGDFAMSLPTEFVLFDEDDNYRAQAADTTIVRGGTIRNEPRGDNTFWTNAIDHEMIGRGEILIESGTSGPVGYVLYQNDDIQPRYYLLGVVTHGEKIFVIEVFYPNKDAFAKHHEKIAKALETFKVN